MFNIFKICAIISLSILNQLAFAVRPFITDDARTVGRRLAQAESWIRYDKPALQHWTLFAYGPNKNLELTAGFVQGLDFESNKRNEFTLGGPLLQGKYLFRPYKSGSGPGFALAAGTILPYGKGAFHIPHLNGFAFATITQCFGSREDVLLHLNIGGSYVSMFKNNPELNRNFIWGFGTQIRTYGGFHLVGEIFSGDPYVFGSGEAFQVGFRHFVSDLIQFDFTYGKGIAGENILPQWASVGIRIVTERFLKS